MVAILNLYRAFYGNRETTKLAAKIHGGSMEQFLPKQGDKEKILSWVQDGATTEGYESVVRPILQQVMAVTQIDRGEPVGLWARVAHTHIQSIALIFAFLGCVFCFTALPERIRIAVAVLPFFVLLADFGTRLLARFWPNIVYLMMGSGTLIGLLFAVMILYPLYEMRLKEA